MSRKNLEEQITPEPKWRKIEDIPNFPLNNFEDLKHRVEGGQFGIDIYVGFPADKLVGQLIYSGSLIKNLPFILLDYTPIIVTFLSLILSFVLDNYWLFIGIVAPHIITLHYSDPSVEHNAKILRGSIVSLLFLVFVYGLWQGKETIIYLSAFFVFPYLTDSFCYRVKRNKLSELVISSEKIFIFLYQAGKLVLKDNSNEQMYRHIEN